MMTMMMVTTLNFPTWDNDVVNHLSYTMPWTMILATNTRGPTMMMVLLASNDYHPTWHWQRPFKAMIMIPSLGGKTRGYFLWASQCF
jgi:hypothetical protein